VHYNTSFVYIRYTKLLINCLKERTELPVVYGFGLG